MKRHQLRSSRSSCSSSLVAFVAVCALAICQVAVAAPIPVTNHSFESPVLVNDGTTGSSAIPGWPFTPSGEVRIMNPNNTWILGTTGTPIPAPGDGSQCTYIRSGGTSLEQALPVVVEANQRYQVVVAAAHRNDLAAFFDLKIEFRTTSGTSLASRTITQAQVLPKGVFYDFVLSYQAPAVGPEIGQQLVFRATSLGTSGSTAAPQQLDNVRAQSVFPPAAYVAIGGDITPAATGTPSSFVAGTTFSYSDVTAPASPVSGEPYVITRTWTASGTESYTSPQTIYVGTCGVVLMSDSFSRSSSLVVPNNNQNGGFISAPYVGSVASINGTELQVQSSHVFGRTVWDNNLATGAAGAAIANNGGAVIEFKIDPRRSAGFSIKQSNTVVGNDSFLPGDTNDMFRVHFGGTLAGDTPTIGKYAVYSKGVEVTVRISEQSCQAFRK